MSQGTYEINPEYYLEVDNVNLRVNIKRYVFDVFHPNGHETTVLSIGYHKLAGYTYAECKSLCERILSMLESTDWRDENNVY